MVSIILSTIVLLFLSTVANFSSAKLKIETPNANKVSQKLSVTKNAIPEDETFLYLQKLSDWSKILTNHSLLEVSKIDKHGKCYKEWKQIVSPEYSKTLKYWDSFAIPFSGYLEGVTVFLGQPEECVNAKKDPLGVGVMPFPETEMFIVSFTLKPVGGTFITIGVCGPSSCTGPEVAEIFKSIVKKPLRPPYYTVATKKDSFNANAAFIISVVVYGIIGILVLAATLLGAWRRCQGFISDYFFSMKYSIHSMKNKNK